MERVAIVGTAPSWNRTPWQDAGLHIVSLNDAYQIGGFARADEWYDIHPIDHFHFVPDPTPEQKTKVFQHEIPVGAYVRPKSHLDWLATQTIPVWLHPDHATQLPESALWPSARAFPKAEIEAHFGRYFTSTPAWMLAHAILQGAREVQIYGIHLSTESEYIEQRPNFEYLMGCLLGRGKRTLTIADGLRYYDSPDGRLVLPEATPILSSNFQYAFETSPRRVLEPLKWELHKASVKRERTIAALKTAPRWSPWVTMTMPDDAGKEQTRRVTRSTLQQELYEYDALVADVQEQIHRAQYEVAQP